MKNPWSGIETILTFIVLIMTVWVLFGDVKYRVRDWWEDFRYGRPDYDDSDVDDELDVEEQPDGSKIIEVRRSSAPLVKRPASGEVVKSSPTTITYTIPKFATPFRLWWAAFLKDAVHVLLVGQTNAGKSTAGRAIARTRIHNGHKVLIIDPHARVDTWHQAVVIGRKRNFDQIEAVFKIISIELAKRYELWGDSREGDDLSDELYPVTLIIDEVPAVMKNCPSAAHVIKEVAREGRKVSLFMVLLTQSDRVKTLNIEGEGDVRDNFWYLYLGEQAVQQDSRCAQLKYPAYLRTTTKAFPVDTIPLGPLSKAMPGGAGRWELITEAMQDPERLPGDRPMERRQLEVPDDDSRTRRELYDDARPSVPTKYDDKAVQALVATGMSVPEIVNFLGGNRKATMDRVVAAVERMNSNG